MKQVLLFGFGILLLAIGVGLYMRPTPPQALSPQASGTTTMFTLYYLSGDVFYKKDGDNNFSVMSGSKVQLPNKTTVKTAVGKAYVLLEDASVITLKENTEILIQVDEKNVSILQMFGKTYHRVETLLTGKIYEVRTPTTLAAVRGTKFGVSYDSVKKETKVAVTESKVAVKEIDDMKSTSTVPMEDFTLVTEGDTATVIVAENSGPKDRPITITKTDNEDEMRRLIDDEVRMDEIFESVKTSTNREDFKKKIEEVMLEVDTKEVPQKESTMVPKKEESEVTEPAKTPIQQKEVEVNEKPVVIKKLDEETFFTAFEPLFIRLFYVDDQLTPCSFNKGAEERVREISVLANTSGYPITSTTNLLAFAKDIDEYCASKKESLKSELQRRFDEEYPYRQ